MWVDGYCTLSPGQSDLLLRQLDAAGVDRAMIAPDDAQLAGADDAGAGHILSEVAAHRDRFIAGVSVNPWKPDAARRLIDSLSAGPGVWVLHPHRQGFTLGEAFVEPLFEAVCEMPTPPAIYVHTGHPGNATPSQVLLLSRRYPTLRWILGHSGATDFASDVIPTCQCSEMIYIESSFARPPLFVEKARRVGLQRSIMGSGWPTDDLKLQWDWMRRLLDAPQQKPVLGGTLLGLLGDANAN